MAFSQNSREVSSDIAAFDANCGELLPVSSSSVSLWRIPNAYKVPRRSALPERKCRGIAVRTAINEAESVQMVVSCGRPLASVKVKPGVWPISKSGEEIPSIAFDILGVGYVSAYRRNGGIAVKEAMPDPLLPQSRDSATSVPKSVNQPYWIRIKPPRGTPKGIYRGTVQVECVFEDGAYETLDVPLAVEVFGFSMPDVYSFRSAFGHGPDMFRYHSAKGRETRAAIVDGYFSMMGENHVSPSFPYGFRPVVCGFSGPCDDTGTAEIQAVFDWEDFDRLTGHAVTTYHFNSFCIRLAGFTAGNSAYFALTDRYLAGIENHLREKGWLCKAYVFYHDVSALRPLFEKHAPAIRQIKTVAPGSVSTNRDDGCEIWYSVGIGTDGRCTPYDIGSAAVDMRALFWRAWAEGVRGIHVPQAMSWNHGMERSKSAGMRNPYSDADRRCLVYPPESCFNGDLRSGFAGGLRKDGTVFDAPVGSIRLDMIRAGIEDFEYLTLLKSLDSGSGLLKIPPEVIGSTRDAGVKYDAMERHRLKIAREIERLSGCRTRRRD